MLSTTFKHIYVIFKDNYITVQVDHCESIGTIIKTINNIQLLINIVYESRRIFNQDGIYRSYSRVEYFLRIIMIVNDSSDKFYKI